MVSAQKLFATLTGGLTARQKEVILGRFGLEKSGEPQTLAALGARYGVTRERVRQIETSALAALREKIAVDTSCLDLINKSKKFLKESGGVAKQEALLANLEQSFEGLSGQHLALFLEASRSFYAHPGDKNLWPLYYLDKDSFKAASTFVNQWVAFLKGKKKEVLMANAKYDEHLKTFLKQSGLAAEHADNYLAVSKRITKNAFGDIGLSEWAEIKPKTVRDRIYLALKKKGEPLHFTTIADLINANNLSAKKASAPTVHNELIKDGRFVLVGRGTYALAEAGYEPGTAREVIHRLLKKNGPLKPKEVMLVVQKERFFKPNTILVNLQNKNFFKRLPDGTYKVREA